MTSTPTPGGCGALSSIRSNFNGTPINAGSYIWFNSVLKVHGAGSGPVTIFVTGQTIRFSANGTNYALDVPDARITFSPTVTVATTVFDTGTNTWVTTVPSSIKEAFLAGLTFQAPVNLPGHIHRVTWSGNFSTDTSGVTLDWQWAAAVYSTFSTDYNALGVKPVHKKDASLYHNDDQPGTPENFKAYVIRGARGDGGHNYTGTQTPPRHVKPCAISESLGGEPAESGVVARYLLRPKR